MAMLCRAMQRETCIKVTGLCHSVQGTAEMLASWIGAPMDEITYVCAGINHQAWYLEYEWNGKDAYPLIRKAVRAARRSTTRSSSATRCSCTSDYYVTESSGHNSEYNWWFRKRPDLIEKYCTARHRLEPRRVRLHPQRVPASARRPGRTRSSKWFDDPAPLDLERGHEYAAYIINACMGGEPFQFNGNVPNTGLITNLPEDACVEVPVFADRRGFNGIHVGALPPQCAALNNLSVAVEEMAVEACLDRRSHAGLPGRRLRPADRRGALAGRDQADGQRDAGAEPGLPAQFKHFRA